MASKREAKRCWKLVVKKGDDGKMIADVVTLLLCKAGECVEYSTGAARSLRTPSGKRADVALARFLAYVHEEA